MPGSERKHFGGEKCESRQTRGQKTLGWPTSEQSDSFLDAARLRRLSPARTTSQIAANVGRQQPATAGLSAVFLRPPSSCRPAHPVAVPQPARHPLQPAVQRQPDGPQPHQLTMLHPRSLLPASDRTHQGDGHPRPRRPLAVCCPGAGLLHRGSEGRLKASTMRCSFSCHNNSRSYVRNSPNNYKVKVSYSWDTVLYFSSRPGHDWKFKHIFSRIFPPRGLVM